MLAAELNSPYGAPAGEPRHGAALRLYVPVNPWEPVYHYLIPCTAYTALDAISLRKQQAAPRALAVVCSFCGWEVHGRYHY